MEKVIDALYKLSNEIHGFLNGCGTFGEGLFWAKGKIFTDEAEAYAYDDPNPRKLVYESFDENGNSIGEWCEPIVHENEYMPKMVDCRYDSVDTEMKKFIQEIIYGYIRGFYYDSDKEDEFLLMLGFSINLYYVVGLYSTFGKFEIEKIISFVENEKIKQYAKLINEFLYAKLTNGIINTMRYWLEVKDVDKYNDVITRILEKKENVSRVVLEDLINPKHKNYVSDIYMLLKENDFTKDADEYLSKMLDTYSEYRFGWIYECLNRGIQFYESEGKNFVVYECNNKLGSELFFHILGLDKLDLGKYELIDGEIKTIRSAIFSEFGIGIPMIKTLSYDNLTPLTEEREISVEEIRKGTESVLGINCSVIVKSDPIRYAIRLFDMVEQQKNKLSEMENQRRDVIRDFSHTYENMQANGLKEIANILMESTDTQFKRCGRVLLAEYGIKDSLKTEINLLRLNFEDRKSDILNFMKNGVTRFKDENTINVGDIFEEALKICLLRIIYSGNPRGEDIKAKAMYNKIKFKVGKMKIFVEVFEDEVILKGTKPTDFLGKFNIYFNFFMDNEWEALFFKRNGYAEVLLRSIFAELSTNIFKYADLESDIKFTLQMKDEKFQIIQSNNINEIVESDSGVGLSSKGEILRKLNLNKCYIFIRI